MRRNVLILFLIAFGAWSMCYNLIISWLPVAMVAQTVPPDRVGSLMAFGYGGAALLSFPIALLADRWGQRAVLLIVWSAALLGDLGLATGGSWLLMLVSAAVAMSSLGALSVLTALMARATPEGSERNAFGWLYAGGPAGLMLASLAGGWAADHLAVVAPLWLALTAQAVAIAAVLALPQQREGGAETVPGGPGPVAGHHTVEHRAVEPVEHPAEHPAAVRRAIAWIRRPENLVIPAGLIGYGLLVLPASFTLVYAGEYLGLSFLSGGLLYTVLGAAQLGWHLLLSRWPQPGPSRQLFGRLPVARGTLAALLIILAAQGAGGLATALWPAAWGFALGLVLRGSLYVLQPLAATLISHSGGRGRSLPLTGVALGVGLATGAGSGAGGLLYGYHPALPFAVTGVAGIVGSLLLAALIRQSQPTADSRGVAA